MTALSASDEALRGLNDLASRLIQIEASDTEAIRRIGGDLRLIAETGKYNGMIRDFLNSAASRLDGVSEDDVPSAETALLEAGRLIEGALNARASGFCEDQEETVKPSHAFVSAEVSPTMLGEFIAESRENIEYAEGALLMLETAPEDLEAINTIFRAFHTIKGMSAFLGFKVVADLAHHTESFLSRIRAGEIRFEAMYADVALRSVDLMKEILHQIQDGMSGPEVAPSAGYDDQIRLLQHLESLATGNIAFAEMAVPLGANLARDDVDAVSEAGQPPRRHHLTKEAGRTVESSVRVRTDRLDRLLNLVGELVISQSMLDQDPTVADGSRHELMAKVGQTGKVVRELQTLSMSLRMVPLKATFQKMTRLARDLSQKSGKPVNLAAFGDETEIDRNLVEVVDELLMHMVRNSIDHGIESPEERAVMGKSALGTVSLRAFHAGGNVVFEIRDDGKGLDLEKIIAKAKGNGLITSTAGMTEGDIYNLIFAPGFSTAERITDVSGRGVGMDVVKNGVESLRGHIETTSLPGKGCLFTLRLPLTMAITNGMVVQVACQRFIVPTLSIKMSMKPTPDLISTVSGRGEMLRFMNAMIPICRLHRVFEIRGAIEEILDGLLVIVEDGDHRLALLVDELIGQAQVVAKALGDGLGRVDGISGGAILGDGRVGLILDITGFAALSKDKGRIRPQESL